LKWSPNEIPLLSDFTQKISVKSAKKVSGSAKKIFRDSNLLILKQFKFLTIKDQPGCHFGVKTYPHSSNFF